MIKKGLNLVGVQVLISVVKKLKVVSEGQANGRELKLGCVQKFKEIPDRGHHLTIEGIWEESMAKELDPALFGEGSWSASRTIEKSKPSVEFLEGKVVDLRMQLREIKNELDRWATETSEYRKSSHQRIEHLGQRLSRVEEVQGRVSDEVVLKVSQLHSRLGERQGLDRKVQDLVDRHHAVLRAAELRHSQLQKIIEEKEAQILATQAALNDARMEIGRLKRL
ncbi:MAG: hypothetical protein C5B49_11385 [Bdellovibrio sp.]|nr:MAG: hypothetical protein C5B49_11385 [Bdellovibrio sp.]